jgi:hypothetical protein
MAGATVAEALASLGATVIAHSDETEAQVGGRELVAAPGAGYRLVITAYGLANELTVGTIGMVSGAGAANTRFDCLWRMGVYANAKLACRVRLPANTNVGFVSTSVGAHSVSVEFHAEAA